MHAKGASVANVIDVQIGRNQPYRPFRKLAAILIYDVEKWCACLDRQAGRQVTQVIYETSNSKS